MEDVKKKNQAIIDKYLEFIENAQKCKHYRDDFIRRKAKKGISQKELAHICGLSRQRIGEIIHHK